MLEIFNEDCMKLMSRYPDKHFDLCICDPPYGGGSHEQHNHKGTIPLRFGGRFDKYREARVDSADDSTNTEIVKKKKKNKNDSRHRRTIRKIRPAGGGEPVGRAGHGRRSMAQTLTNGTSLPRRNIFLNWNGFQNAGLSAAEITSGFRRTETLLFGGS